MCEPQHQPITVDDIRYLGGAPVLARPSRPLLSDPEADVLARTGLRFAVLWASPTAIRRNNTYAEKWRRENMPGAA